MKKRYVLPLILISAIGISAQTETKKSDDKLQASVTSSVKTDDKSLMELAKATLIAHGGDKFKNVKSIVIRGTADISAPNSAQTMPATFAIIYAGEKYRFDITAPPVVNFQQISDGTQTHSSMRAFSLPPINRVGLPVLAYIDNKDFVISALPEKFKKKKGFRVTTPEGFYTDFIVDEKTSQVKEYESSYEANGQLVTTSVAVDKYRDVEGIPVNEKFSQRLDFGQMTVYTNYKAKEITVNTVIKDDVFAMPK